MYGPFFFTKQLSPAAQSSNVLLHVCLSSRHYPQIKISKCLEIALEREQGHTEGIKRYIDSALDLEGDITVDLFEKEILEESNGIFLWVVLVIGTLNEEYPGKPIKAMRQRLKEIPGDLSKLFCKYP